MTALQRREAAFQRFQSVRSRAWEAYQREQAVCDKKLKASYARFIRLEMRETKRYARACQVYDATRQ